MAFAQHAGIGVSMRLYVLLLCVRHYQDHSVRGFGLAATLAFALASAVRRFAANAKAVRRFAANALTRALTFAVPFALAFGRV